MKFVSPYTAPPSLENRNETPSILNGLVIAGLCVTFGANATAIKISLTGLGAFTTAGIRFALASLIIALWAWVTDRPFKLKKGQFHKIFFIACLFIGQINLFYTALRYTHASRGTLLSNLQPFLVLVLAHFMIPGDRITLKKFIGISCGFTGVVFLFLQKKGITPELRIGDMLALLSVFLWAFNAVYTKKIIHEFRPFQVVLYQGLLGFPVFFLEGFFWDSPMVFHMSLPVILALIYQGLVTASFGFVMWLYFLNRFGAVTLHAYVFILPISGVFFGGVVLGEPVATRAMILSLCLIVMGIVLIHSRRLSGHG